MSFRPFNWEICRASVAGAFFLACIAISRGGDFQTQSTEISLSADSNQDTNTTQLQLGDSPSSQFFLPHAPNTFRMPNRPANLPPPRPQVTISSDKEKELLDRRKNWVFMTPEEMMGTDPESQKDSDSPDGKYDKNGQEKVTVMERYYQRLYDSDHEQKTTNQLNKFDADSWTKTSSAFDPADNRQGIGPFNSTPDLGVFQQTHTGNSQGIFGGGRNVPALTPEEVRLKAEQDAHMESFKQLWNIDQPQTPTTVVSTPTTPTTTVQPLNASVFGAQDNQSTFNAMNQSLNGGYADPTAPPPPPSTVSEVRSHSSPPRATFKPVSSPF